MASQSKQSKNAEILSDIIAAVDEIPIEEIVGKYVELHQRGMHYLGLCPFHPDQHLGSFVVTPFKGLWRCFTEGIGGGGISFEMMYNELKYIPAVLKLALEHGIITLTEYNALSKRRFSNTFIRKVQRNAEAAKEEVRADERVVHTVYSAMLQVSSLSAEHREHLMKERHLSLDDLEDYFTFPTRNTQLAKNIWNCLLDAQAQRLCKKDFSLCEEGEQKRVEASLACIRKQMKLVPGFYYDKEAGKHSFVSYKGIGFAVRDANGRIKGIQIRRDTVKDAHQSRYIWFSSGFMANEENIIGGASPGAPGGVIYPKGQVDELTGLREDAKDTGCLCITEGRFKAEKIAECGNTAIYVSGVSSWRSVIPTVKEIVEKKHLRKVYLLFDADLLGNAAVHGQLKSMAEELHKLGLSTVVVLWDIAKGKGFDDLLIGEGDGYAKCLSYLPFSEFEQLWKVTSQKVLADFGVKHMREIPKDKAEEFTNSLQQTMTKEFKLSK